MTDRARDGDPRTWSGVRLRLALAAMAVVAFALGYVGFQQMAHAGLGRPPIESMMFVDPTWTDFVYYTLQLFVLGSETFAYRTSVPVTLEIARFLAPATTLLALALTARTVLDSTYYAARTRRLSGHTVICGSGAPAVLLARSVSEDGGTCVVLDGTDRDTSPGRHEAVTPRRGSGSALRLGGDPRELDVLRSARVDHAREVVVVTGDSARNADVASRLREAVEEAATVPRCFLEMASPELAAGLAAHEITSGSRLRIEFFDPVDLAARRLLDAHLPAVTSNAEVVVVGDGVRRDALLSRLGRRLAGTDADRSVRTVRPDDLGSLACDRSTAVAFVCADDDLVAIRLALATHHRLRDRPVEVVVMTASSTALGAVVSGDDLTASRTSRAHLTIFNALDHVYSMTALQDGFYLDIARVAHDEYVRSARRRGEGPSRNPSAVWWAELPDHLRRSNLDQAFHVGAKVRAIGCAVVPLGEADGAENEFGFEGGELERLARLEHERWLDERTRDGWRVGPRDVDARTSPDLVPWERLGEEARQKDRDAVEAIPRQLREVGLRILRPRR